MRTLLACAVLAMAASAQMTALVNDSLSHGTLGDGKLSLDEAIRIMNTALPYGSLSAAEQAQLRGAPITVLDTIEVDASITPVITLERQLTNVIGDVVTHVDCNFEGLNGRPVIDGSVNGVAEVFPARTNHFHLRDFVLKGGQAGVVYDASLHYHPGEVMLVDGCRFEGQTVCGVQIRVQAFPPGGIQPARLVDTVFDGLPVALEILDRGLSGDTDVSASRLTFDRCQTAIHLAMGGVGGSVDAVFDRIEVTASETAVLVTRAGGSDSALDAEFVHGSFEASGSAFDVQGASVGVTSLALHHADVRGGTDPGDHALATTPPDSALQLTVGEVHFDGDVLLQAGRFGSELRVHNSRFANGPVTVTSTGPDADLQWNVHEDAPLNVSAGTSAAVTVHQSELVRSGVTDATAGGVVTLRSCFRSQSPLTGPVTERSPAASRWIGQASVTPSDPAIGAFVDLAVDLHPGTAAVWLVGLSVSRPTTAAVPLRFYLDVTSFGTLPGVYQLQQVARLPIPNNPFLVGFELYAQPVVVPGQPSAPAFHLLRGGRFTIR